MEDKNTPTIKDRRAQLQEVDSVLIKLGVEPAQIKEWVTKTTEVISSVAAYLKSVDPNKIITQEPARCGEALGVLKERLGDPLSTQEGDIFGRDLIITHMATLLTGKENTDSLYSARDALKGIAANGESKKDLFRFEAYLAVVTGILGVPFPDQKSDPWTGSVVSTPDLISNLVSTNTDLSDARSGLLHQIYVPRVSTT